MKSNTRIFRIALLASVAGISGLLMWTFLFAPRHPIALLQVVDGAGKPIEGAIIRPEGLRTKPGPYAGGWYGWLAQQNGVPNPPVKTDAMGHAHVPYPKYVFERIETGTLCLAVEHPDYVPQRPERMVAVAPPVGAPWHVWFDYVWGRVRHKALVVRADPIVLQRGAILRLSVKPGSGVPGVDLYAQTSGRTSPGTNFWFHPGPGVLLTRSLSAGTQGIRAIQFESNAIWFGPTVKITATIGQTNEIVAELKPGVAVSGRLDDTIPRPVRNGRVIAQIYPEGEKAENDPPEWHAWCEIQSDGTFTLPSLPEGQLELVAVCDGFVSTNGTGQFPSMHYPQKFGLGSEGLRVTLGMEPTACLEVKVEDDDGKPLKGAQVSCWPNVRYGEWSATIIGQDCYNTAGFLTNGPEMTRKWWDARSFCATSDVSGLAFISNLPAEANVFSVEHPRFVLPASVDSIGQRRRNATISLHPPQTNRVTVRLEPAGAAPIGHF